MKNIRLFETTSAYTEARENDYIEPWVSYTREDEDVNYNKPAPNYDVIGHYDITSNPRFLIDSTSLTCGNMDPEEEYTVLFDNVEYLAINGNPAFDPQWWFCDPITKEPVNFKPIYRVGTLFLRCDNGVLLIYSLTEK